MKKKRHPHLVKQYTMLDEMMASPTEPLAAEKRQYQLLRMYEGLRSLETAPEPSTEDWRLVSDAVNLMETLVLEMKVCEDASGLLMDAITALAKAGQRSKAGGVIRLDGAGMQALRAVLSDYADLLEMLPARTMVRCHRLTEKRIHDILQGKLRPHDVEITRL